MPPTEQEAVAGATPLRLFSFCSLLGLVDLFRLESAMASEMTVAASVEISFDNGEVQDALSVLDADTVRTISTQLHHKSIQSVATSEEAVSLGAGDISTRGVCLLINLDPTNYIEVKTGTGGTIFAKLFPRGSGQGINFCFLHLGSGAQSPYVIANTAACRMAIFLASL